MVLIRSWKPRLAVLAIATLVSIYTINIWFATLDPLSYKTSKSEISLTLRQNVSRCDNLEPLNLPLACFNSTSKNAYATVLTGYNGPDSDKYYFAVRLLIYQLVHDGRTRALNGAPVIVLVTEDVPLKRREMMKRDGASVLVVDSITRKWIQPKWARWGDVITKLNLWTLENIEKILFLDADTILLNRLDDIFSEPATALQKTSPAISEHPKTRNQPSLPEEYMIAGIHDRWIEHNLPPERGEKGLYAMDNYMNAGFFVFSPSRRMYEYYLALLDMPHKIDMTYPEQNLLNYAHRTDGRMPWKGLRSYWNAMTSLDQHFAPDVRSLHHKWWQTVENQTVNDYIAVVVENMIEFHNSAPFKSAK
ncbi:nucleotide-diphospho-sugar transferase [Trichoderma chlorosporum]